MSRRSEYLSAALWAVFGLIIVIASWRIDRLENLSINPWSVPGLTPGVVGVLMILLALALGLQVRGRARADSADPNRPPGMPGQAGIPGQADGQADGGADARAAGSGEAPDVAGAASTGGSADPGPVGSLGRTGLAGALCVLFAGVSLGRGLPFVAEGAVFIFVFTTAFSWVQWRAEGRIARSLLMTLVIAVAASVLISWLFESVFLVRLP